MKQGNALVNFVMFALAAALACYMGVYIYHGFSDPFTTTFAYSYVSDEGVETQGLLVREESVFPAQNGIVDVTRAEGEKVGKGHTVALIHRDDRAMQLQAEMDELETQVALLDYALGYGDSQSTTARLDEDVLQSIVSLRASAAVNDYSDLEEQTKALKSQVLKRDYTYNEELELEQLQAQRAELVSRYKALKSQAGGATSRVTASRPGTFSALVDGFEEVLTPASLQTITPSQLDEISGLRPGESSSPGKLITSSRWYYVTALDQDSAARLKVGKEVLVTFTGEFSRDVEMKVERVGEPEGERCIAVFSSEEYLKETLLLRQQNAQVVFARSEGLRVPKISVRMEEHTYVVNKETGETATESWTGVYALVGGKAEFKRVKIQGEGGEYFVVTPLTEDSRSLRAGDEVIVRATGLEDGKLLEY